ncbi:MAG: hypothetical protein J5818_03380, partial [Eggerthellaceae bacterium]|nr:hypothetical protein [Eggerthellaceae bacterium]
MPYEPYEDDEVRRAARERLQARMERRGSTSSLASHSGTRLSGRGSSEKSPGRQAERTTEHSRGGSSGASGTPLEGVSGAFGSARDRVGGLLETSGDNRTVEVGPVSFDLPFAVPDRIPPIAVPIAALIIILLLIFAVLIPSCTRAATPAPTSQSAASASAAATDASASAASASATDASAASTSTTNTGTTTTSTTDASTTTTASQPTSLILQVAQAKSRAQDAVQAASNIDSVDKQESHQAALVELLGDETSAKLLAQAKTSIDALWIAAHPSAYAYDGVEVQYKALKLAADEPAALDYVREFPENYPA